MAILRLTISCFTGIGVLVLLVTLLVVAWLVVTLRRLEREKPAHLPDLPGVFTQEQIAALAALKEQVEAERRTYGAEYDSTC